jgi:hypothetical protein
MYLIIFSGCVNYLNLFYMPELCLRLGSWHRDPGLMVVSRVLGSVTNNKGLWIG